MKSGQTQDKRVFHCARLDCGLPGRQTQYEPDHLLDEVVHNCERCRRRYVEAWVIPRNLGLKGEKLLDLAREQ